MKRSIKQFLVLLTIISLFLISITIYPGGKTSKSPLSLTGAKKLKVNGYFSITKKPHTIFSRQDFWIKLGDNLARLLNVTADGYVIPEYTPGRYLSSMSGYKAITGHKILVDIKFPASGRIELPNQPKNKPKVYAVAIIGNMATFTQPKHEGSYTFPILSSDIIFTWTSGKSPYTLSIYEKRRKGKNLYYKEGIISTSHSVPAEIFSEKGMYEISLIYNMNKFSFSGDYLPGSKLILKYITYINITVK